MEAQEGTMRRMIADRTGLFSVDIEVEGGVLYDAIEHDRAEEVLSTAVAAALSVLTEDEPWLDEYLEHLAHFMLAMRHGVIRDGLS